jgi:hypothetical protein
MSNSQPLQLHLISTVPDRVHKQSKRSCRRVSGIDKNAIVLAPNAGNKLEICVAGKAAAGKRKAEDGEEGAAAPKGRGRAKK